MNAAELIMRRWKPVTESSVPPYEQIRLRIVDLAAAGELAVGMKLPSVRALATELGVAANTVARAYRELEHAGIVVTAGRSGTVIASGGDQLTEAVATAAAEFAGVVLKCGVPSAKALAMVSAALERGATR
ncbi:GntR family transcriptional regulator [Arthrobacter sp. ERGS1:01]|uniref:GntR family transcriptional regulator n=1 Tax=Arthrobacter sp. ERGS1:01 TaxID=1704044 RepID=UPI000B0571A6|nr:GntR family transcriptional regulator [Arthrobacter sp. ERGS1:01]